jgi:diguanylate cyclase (GGDEF)-like protein
VDNLKLVNDQFGHEAGDMLLTAVAGLLRRSTRAVDIAARLGGDEFALWLDGVAAAEVARGRADTLCVAASALALTASGTGAPLPVSVSLGVAIATGVEETPEALLARADSALYAAKRAGRNAWRLAGDPPRCDGHAHDLSR